MMGAFATFSSVKTPTLATANLPGDITSMLPGIRSRPGLLPASDNRDIGIFISEDVGIKN